MTLPELYTLKEVCAATKYKADTVCRKLKAHPEIEVVGSGPLCAKLKVKFTPHMARHWLGKKLDANGAGLKTIQKALGQASEKSASRYAVSDVETVRAATRRIGGILGKSRRSA